MAFLAILGLSVGLAVAYGVLHDLVTAHVCVEYFTVGHAGMGGPVDHSPWVQALFWGFAATWWMGLLLGLLLACAARLGPWPPRSPRSLLRPLLALLLVGGAAALLAGLLGAWLAGRGQVTLVGPWAAAVPPERHVAFLADLWAHNASYLVGGLGGLVLAAGVLRVRQKSGPAAQGPGPADRTDGR